MYTPNNNLYHILPHSGRKESCLHPNRLFFSGIRKNSGFTLVELIVVIVILAILATIAFLSFSHQSSSARDSTRMSDMSSISKGLGVFNAISGKYPLPDDKVSVLSGTSLLGYQGYAGSGVLGTIRLSNGGKDPLDGSHYIYNTNFTQSKFQLAGFLENQGSLAFSPLPFGSFRDSSELSAISYAGRYPYERGDTLGIILELTGSVSSPVYTPIQDLPSVKSFGGLDVSSGSSSYVVVLDNAASMTGVSLSNVGKSYVGTGMTVGTQYSNCLPTSYSGYTIGTLTSGASLSVAKSINYGTGDLSVSCYNGSLSYGAENINCISNYVLQSGACVQDICTGSAPDFSIATGIQKVGVNWSHNTSPGQCTFVCQQGYFWNGNSCQAASAGNYVSSSGATAQTQCAAGTYQSLTGSTSCQEASAGYYVASAGATSQSAVGLGQYQDLTGQSIAKSCTNKPVSNSAYTTSSALTSNSCPWACNASYHNESGSCVSDTRSCSITNGAGTQTWNGSSWSMCIPTSCNAGYYSNGSSCVVPAWSGDATSGFTYFQGSNPVYPRTCNELLTSATPNYKIGNTSWNGTKFVDGIYYLKPDSSAAFKTYCDMTTSGGGWTVIASDGLSVLTQSLMTTSTVPKPNQAGLLMPFISANLKDFASEMRVVSVTGSTFISYDITPSWLGANLSLKNSEYGYMYTPGKGFSGGAGSPYKCNFSLIVVGRQACEDPWTLATPADGSTLGATKGYPSYAYGSADYSWQFLENGVWYRVGWTNPTGYRPYYDAQLASYIMIKK